MTKPSPDQRLLRYRMRAQMARPHKKGDVGMRKQGHALRVDTLVNILQAGADPTVEYNGRTLLRDFDEGRITGDTPARILRRLSEAGLASAIERHGLHGLCEALREHHWERARAYLGCGVRPYGWFLRNEMEELAAQAPQGMPGSPRMSVCYYMMTVRMYHAPSEASYRDVMDFLAREGHPMDPHECHQHPGEERRVAHPHSLLSAALRLGDVALVHHLVEAGVSVADRNPRGEGVLHAAASSIRRRDLPQVWNALVDAGADPEVTDKLGRRAGEREESEESEAAKGWIAQWRAAQALREDLDAARTEPMPSARRPRL